jgi:hypothetical protein
MHALVDFILTNGVLVPKTKKDEASMLLFKKQLPEGSIVTAFFDEQQAHGSVALNAKIHKMIRVLALDTGYDYLEMKKLVKKEAGLIIWAGDSFAYKSFSVCSKDELSLAIQACVAIGIKVDSFVC